MAARTPKRSTLQALLVVLLVLTAIAGGFLAYFYSYTSNNRIYLEQRNYRVLSTVARQVGARIEGIGKAWKNAVDGCPSDGESNTASACVEPKLKQIPELESVDCSAFADDSDAENQAAKRTRQWAVAGDGEVRFSHGSICAVLKLGKVANASLADPFFDDYILSDETGRILYRQQDRWGDLLLERAVSPSSAGADTAREGGASPESAKFSVQEPHVGKHAAEEYLRFSQPMRIAFDGASLSWWIHGQVQKQKFQSQVWQVSPTVVSSLVVAIVTLLLGWPILKLWLLGPREIFQTIDVYALTLSCLFGAGLLAAYGLDTYAYRAVAAQRFDAGLRDLADKIVTNFYDEVRRCQTILAKFAENPENRWVDPGTLKEYAYADLYRADSTGKIGERWAVVSAAGEQPTLQKAESTTNVADREYFRDAQEGRLFWRFAADKGFAAELVRSKLSGQLTFVLAVPTADSAHKPPKERDVELVSIPLISLIDAVMPFGFGFAVVDKRGDVVVHRHQQRSGQENILEECEGDSRLAAALETQRELLTRIRYYGRPHQFYVRALPNTPWSLIVFRNREPLQTTNAAIFQVAVAMFAVYLAVPALFLAVLQFERRYRAEWLWPRREYADVYALGAAVLLCESVVLFGAIEYAYAWPRFLLLAAVPAHCWCFLHLLLATHTRVQRVAVFTGLTAAGALIVVAASMSHNPGASVFWAGAVVALSLGIVVIVWRRGVVGARRSERVFRAAYASLLTMACATVAVGPATLLFRDAFDQGMTGFVRYGQFKHVDALVQRADRVYGLYHDESKRGGTPKDRLETNLDVYTIPLFGNPAAPSSPDRAGDERERTPYLSEPIFPLLPSHQLAVGRVGLLAETVANDRRATWRSESNGGPRSLQLEITDAALTDRLRDVTPSLRSLRADLFSVLPRSVEAGAAGFAFAWGIGIGALMLLTAAISRRVFLLDADATLAIRPAFADGTPVLATWVAIHRAKHGGEGVVVIDLSAVHEASGCASLLSGEGTPRNDGERETAEDERGGEPAPGIVIIAHLETRPGDPQWTEAKLALIERLLFDKRFADKVSIVLLSPANLMQRWGTFPKPTPQGRPGATAAEEGAARRWAELMRSFTSDWVHLPQSEAYFAQALDASRSKMVTEACLPFAEAWGSTASYHDAWSTSSLEEKLALVHLASEGFLNPGMLDAVTSLIQRGVVIRDPALRFLDPGFAKYVLAAQDDTALVDWRATAPRGDWERLRVPGMILLAVVIAFLYTTQRGVWDSTSALIAAVSGGVPTVLKFLGLFKSDSGGAGKSGAS